MLLRTDNRCETVLGGKDGLGEKKNIRTRSKRYLAVAAAYCAASSVVARVLRGWTRSHKLNTSYNLSKRIISW